MTANIMDWPLDTPLATFGGPVAANNSARCGLVEERGRRDAHARPGAGQPADDVDPGPGVQCRVRDHGPADRHRREPMRGDLRPRGLTATPRPVRSAHPHASPLAGCVRWTGHPVRSASSGGVPPNRGSVAPRLPKLPMLAAVAVPAAACAGGSGASPRPSPQAETSTAWLRRAAIQDRGQPVGQFAYGPAAVVTADGTFVTAAPVEAEGPEPLLPNLLGRPLSDAGRDASRPRPSAFTSSAGRRTSGASSPCPEVLGRLQLTVDGEPVTLTGEPDSKLLCIPQFCDPFPGTPEAFGELWRKVADPAHWLADELGPRPRSCRPPTRSLSGPRPVRTALAHRSPTGRWQPRSPRSARRWPRSPQVWDRQRRGCGHATPGARGGRRADEVGPGRWVECHLRCHGPADHRR